MENYEKMDIREVERRAKQKDGDALFEMAWRLESMPSELPNNDPAYRCAWQDYWFEKAADTGHVDARSRYARSLINRIFDAECRQKAMKYFEGLAKDFDAGKLKGDLEIDGIVSKLWLGIMLCQGFGTRRDTVEGAKLLKEADVLTQGFSQFGYEALSNLAEVYGQGCLQKNGVPTIDDLRQAVAYQKKAVERFNPEKNDPNNRGILGNAKKYLENIEALKELANTQKDIYTVLGLSFTDSSNSSWVSPIFVDYQKKMTALIPGTESRLEADKAAIAHIHRCMARLGW